MKGNSKKDKSYYAKTIFLFLEIFKIIKQDPKLIWRQKSRLNLDFQGTRVFTNSLGLRNRKIKIKKDRHTFRIVCLGASPTFGWGVKQDKIYSSCLEKLLQESKGIKKKIEVINAAQIGYSSYQGLVFLKEYILKLSPDLITVPYVINDVDVHRFYRSNDFSDKDLKPKSKIAISLANFFSRSSIYNWLKYVMFDNQFDPSQQGKGRYYSGQRRVPVLDYRRNLKNFIRIAKENNAKLLFVIMPVNLPEAKELSREQEEREKLYLDKAYQNLEEKKYRLSIESAQKVLKFNPWSSKAFYCLSFCFEGKNNFSQAKTYFQKAKEAESRQCGRLGKIYNNVMREVAKENNIALSDIALSFGSISKEGGDYLFLDPKGDTIHPNEKGHEAIARQLCGTLIEYKLI